MSRRMVRNVSGCDGEDIATQAEQMQGRGQTRASHVQHSQVPGVLESVIYEAENELGHWGH